MKEGALGSFFRRMMLRIKRFFFMKKKKKESNEENLNKKIKIEKKERLKKTEEENNIMRIRNNKGIFNIEEKGIKGFEQINLKQQNVNVMSTHLNPFICSNKKSSGTFDNDLLKPQEKGPKLVDKGSFKLEKESKNISEIQNPNKKGIHLKKGNPVLDKEINKLVRKFKDKLVLTESKLDLLKEDYNNKKDSKKIIKELEQIEKQIEEYYKLYFNIKEVEFTEIKELEKFYDEIKELNRKEYEYFNNLDIYNTLVLLDIKKEKLIKFINEKNDSNEQEKFLNIENGNLKECRIKNNLYIENNYDKNIKEEEKIKIETETAKEKKIKNKDNFISIQKEIIEEKQKKLLEIKKEIEKIKIEKIKIPKYSNSIFSGIIQKIKGGLLITSSIPLAIIGSSLPTMVLSMYMVKKGIRKIRSEINKNKEIDKRREKRIEEQMLISINSYNSLDYFVNGCLMELNQLNMELNEEFIDDENLREYKSKLNDIQLELLNQKLKIEQSKKELNKGNSKILNIINK